MTVGIFTVWLAANVIKCKHIFFGLTGLLHVLGGSVSKTDVATTVHKFANVGIVKSCM